MPHDRILDTYLVAAARAGDRQARALLVHRWHKRLLAHAVRLTGDAEGARDMVQESWIEILHGLNRLRDDQAFPAWAYRITSRRCAKAVRSQSRARTNEQLMMAEAEPEACEIPHDAGETVRLRGAIRALPPGQRAAIALYHFDELSVAEVAVALDVPVGTVKTRLMHARCKLRAALEGDD